MCRIFLTQILPFRESRNANLTWKKNNDYNNYLSIWVYDYKVQSFTIPAECVMHMYCVVVNEY